MGEFGLYKDEVRLEKYNKKWEVYFNEEKELIDSILQEGAEIHHIGSTSIQDMVAKPIIDIMIAVMTKDEMCGILEDLCKLGYLFLGDGGRYGRLFLVKGEEITTHHLHLVLKGSKYYKDYLKFKRILLDDRKVFNKYYKLKKVLVSGCKDRDEYRVKKAKFIEKVLNFNC